MNQPGYPPWPGGGYGGFGGFGGYGGPPPMGPNSKTANKARFEPSQSIREAILDHLEKQGEYITKESARLQKLVALGTEGRDVPGDSKGPGDIQLSGTEKVKVKATAKNHVSFGQVSKHMRKFCKLEEEIVMLVRIATRDGGMSKRGNSQALVRAGSPTPMLRGGLTLIKPGMGSPLGGMYGRPFPPSPLPPSMRGRALGLGGYEQQLKKVLGPADNDDDDDEDSDDSDDADDDGSDDG